MELALDYPRSFGLLERMTEGLSAVARGCKAFAAHHSQQQALRASVDGLLFNTGELCQYFPIIPVCIENEPPSPATYQAQVGIIWVMRDIHYHLSCLRHDFKRSPALSGGQFKELKRQMHEYYTSFLCADTLLANKYNFPLSNTILKNSLGTLKLNAPFRIFIEDDDTGKHVQCFEVPQVYGFGETEVEALEMLDREIIAIYEEMKEPVPLTMEYTMLKDFLGTVIDNEE